MQNNICKTINQLYSDFENNVYFDDEEYGIWNIKKMENFVTNICNSLQPASLIFVVGDMFVIFLS